MILAWLVQDKGDLSEPTATSRVLPLLSIMNVLCFAAGKQGRELGQTSPN
jgi:hypothetical protein